jgi:hypothetical protein
MAIEVYEFAVTIPAGTAITAPTTTKCSMPTREVQRIEIKVPPGPNGQMGFRVGGSGQQFIPRGAGQWVVTNNEEISWDITDAFDSGDWDVIGYNTGDYAHTIYIRFLVVLPLAANPLGPAPIPVEQLSSLGETHSGG